MNLRNLLPWIVLALVAACLACGGALADDEKVAAENPAPVPRSVDLVICLDTSGSMQGLIHSARQKLWSVVSEVATLKPEPRLRVALLTYGSPGDAARGFVVVQTDFTQDLDLVSEKLFALGTNGGTELVGRVLHVALEDLSWTQGDALRTVFVAGNESADQDTVQRYDVVARRAAERGVFVNAVYCGGADDADGAGWRKLAAVGTGSFSHIDHDNGTVNVETPFDKELAELSSRLNGTYVFFGREREVAAERQAAQDENAKKAGAPAAAARAEAKAGALYRAPQDLVEKLKDEAFDLDEVADEELPEELRKLDAEGRRAWLEARAKERAALQARIQELGAQRAAHVRKVMEEQRLDDSRSLDRALRDAVREQAARKGFEAPAPQPR
jgi:hypothetical protein